MIQLVGTDVAGTDRNHIIADPHALGAWWPEGSEYALMALDPKDPVVVAIRKDIALLAAAVGKVNTREVAELAAFRDMAPLIQATSAAVMKLQLVDADPVALAQAIADHITLAAKP